MAKDLITTVTTKNDFKQAFNSAHLNACRLYTSDAADEIVGGVI